MIFYILQFYSRLFLLFYSCILHALIPLVDKNGHAQKTAKTKSSYDNMFLYFHMVEVFIV